MNIHARDYRYTVLVLFVMGVMLSIMHWIWFIPEILCLTLLTAFFVYLFRKEARLRACCCLIGSVLLPVLIMTTEIINTDGKYALVGIFVPYISFLTHSQKWIEQNPALRIQLAAPSRNI